MNKKIKTPSFAGGFVCLAGSCPDTCCKGWDIAVDDETLAFYRSLKSDSITKNIIVDEDGDHVLKFVNGVCPFLDSGKLCGIQKQYGAERICRACREFPRITQDYTEFEERLLTLACPEAARLMIVESGDFSFIDRFQIERSDNGYDRDLMNFLLRFRYLTAGIFRENGDFSEKLGRAYALTAAVQRLIDNDDLTAEPVLCKIEPPDTETIFALHRCADVMDASWLDEIEAAKGSPVSPSACLCGELSRLALYYIGRYYLTAVSSYDVITTMIRLHCAAEVCAALISYEKCENDPARRALIYQKYSKEIEHSDENLEAFEDLAAEVLPVGEQS